MAVPERPHDLWLSKTTQGQGHFRRRYEMLGSSMDMALKSLLPCGPWYCISILVLVYNFSVYVPFQGQGLEENEVMPRDAVSAMGQSSPVTSREYLLDKNYI